MLMGLKEGQEKMSKSDPDSAIFMEDSVNDVCVCRELVVLLFVSKLTEFCFRSTGRLRKHTVLQRSLKAILLLTMLSILS